LAKLAWSSNEEEDRQQETPTLVLLSLFVSGYYQAPVVAVVTEVSWRKIFKDRGKKWDD
jgi:hypothetical protein